MNHKESEKVYKSWYEDPKSRNLYLIVICSVIVLLGILVYVLWPKGGLQASTATKTWATQADFNKGIYNSTVYDTVAQAISLSAGLPDYQSTGGWVNMANNNLLMHANDNPAALTTTEISDSSPAGNTGTCSGTFCPTTVVGRIGNAFKFDGVNDYIDYGNKASLDPTQAATLSAWVKFDQLPSQAGRIMEIAAKSGGGTDIDLQAEPDNKFHFYIDGGYPHMNLSTTVITTGVWYHVVATYTANTDMKLYINGNLESTVAIPGITRSTNANRFCVGQSCYWANRYLNGVIDEVGMWNRSISATEVTELLNNGVLADMSGNVLLSHFEENIVPVPPTATNIVDSSGANNNGACNVGQCPGSTAGKVNGAFSFNGSQFITIPNDVDVLAQGTFSAWINPDPSWPCYAIIFDKSAGSGVQYRIQRDGCSSRLEFYDGQNIRTGGNIVAGQWNHIAITINNGVATGYINGQQVFTGTVKNPLTNLNCISYIGRYSGSGAVYKGKMDEMAIWSRVLTAAEILKIYQSQLAGTLATGGTYTSQVFDTTLTDKAYWTNLTWSADVPSDATLVLSARSCDDLQCNGESWTEIGGASPQDISSLAPNQYFQYKFDFTRTTNSPKISNVTLEYSTTPPDTDGDGIFDKVDACPTIVGTKEFQGCPFGISNFVVLHIIDQAKIDACGGAGSCKEALEGAEIKLFDTNDASFISKYTANPKGTEYGLIFEDNTGLAGKCTTDYAGTCIAGIPNTSKYLSVVKYTDMQSGKSVYSGTPLGPEVDSSETQIIKTYKKDGTIEFKGGSKTVVSGSFLEIVYPVATFWSDSLELYPFVFISDSDWETNICAQVPEGYMINSIYDNDGNAVETSECTQSFVSNEAKVVLFEIAETGSPEPDMAFKLSLKHNGEEKQADVSVNGLGKESAVAQNKELATVTETTAVTPTATTPIATTTKVKTSWWTDFWNWLGNGCKKTQ